MAQTPITWRAHRERHPVIGRRLILVATIDGTPRIRLGRTFALKRRVWYVHDLAQPKGNPIVGHHRSRKAAMAHAHRLLRQHSPGSMPSSTPGNGSYATTCVRF